MNPLLGLRTPRSRHRDRADRVIDREYEGARGTVLRVTGAKLRQVDLSPDPRDLEAAYNQAWHALYERLAAGAEIENRTAFLVTITYRRAIDEYRVTRPERHRELSDDVPAVEPDPVRRLDDRRRLRALRTGMRERLDDRELRAATLCYLHGYSRREAAEVLGVSPRRMEKVMDRVSKRMARLTADVDGDWCEQQRSLIHAYALGVLDPDGARHPLAVAHLEDCPGCRRRVLMLRGLTAAAPPVPLLLADGGSVDGGAAPPGDRPEAGPDTGTATAGGRTGPATAAASVVVAAIGVTIGVVLLVDRDAPPPSAPPAPAPASAARAPAPAATTAARDRERAAARRRDRAARERAERRRAERARAHRAAAPSAAVARDDASSPAATPAAPSAASSAAPAGAVPETSSAATSPSSGSAPPPGSGSSSNAGSGSSPGSGSGPSPGSASTDVVTDGAEEFDLGD